MQFNSLPVVADPLSSPYADARARDSMQRGVVISSCQLQAGMWYIAVADLFQQSPSPPPVQFHITVSMESSALINHNSHDSSVCCSLTKYFYIDLDLIPTGHDVKVRLLTDPSHSDVIKSDGDHVLRLSLQPHECSDESDSKRAPQSSQDVIFSPNSRGRMYVGVHSDTDDSVRFMIEYDVVPAMSSFVWFFLLSVIVTVAATCFCACQRRFANQNLKAEKRKHEMLLRRMQVRCCALVVVVPLLTRDAVADWGFRQRAAAARTRCLRFSRGAAALV